MNKLFTAIRHSDIDTVKELLTKKPELVNCTAKQPPKKDDGQSPLQIALKTGNLEIATYLINQGANLNFMENEETCCNTWRCPVIHDAIGCAVMCSRWNGIDHLAMFQEKDGKLRYKVHSTKEKADEAYHILETMLRRGADVNAESSLGASGLDCFCRQAAQVLPSYNYAEQCIGTDRLFTNEIREDLLRILVLLRDSGADIHHVDKNWRQTALQFHSRFEDCVHELLTCVFSENVK